MKKKKDFSYKVGVDIVSIILGAILVCYMVYSIANGVGVGRGIIPIKISDYTKNVFVRGVKMSDKDLLFAREYFSKHSTSDKKEKDNQARFMGSFYYAIQGGGPVMDDSIITTDTISAYLDGGPVSGQYAEKNIVVFFMIYGHYAGIYDARNPEDILRLLCIMEMTKDEVNYEYIDNIESWQYLILLRYFSGSNVRLGEYSRKEIDRNIENINRRICPQGIFDWIYQ